MTQLTPMQPRETRAGSGLDDLLHSAAFESPRAVSSAELTVGSPEHAELIASILREFPEVYEPTTRLCNAD